MYRAHSKDINRNKSFHPLTYANLSRVERLKERQDEKAAQASERQRELLHDQEERRYDELLLSNSSSSFGGVQARLRQTRNIFAAEYEAEVVSESGRQQLGEKVERTSGPSEVVPEKGPPSGPASLGGCQFLSKFHKDPLSKLDTSYKAEATSAKRDGAPLSTSTGMTTKRQRNDGSCDEVTAVDAMPLKSEKSVEGVTSAAPTTGFVTSAEAARLRDEKRLLQKQRHDPLVRVRQYQNSHVAAEARRLEASAMDGDLRAGTNDSELMKDRIRKLMDLRSQKKH